MTITDDELDKATAELMAAAGAIWTLDKGEQAPPDLRWNVEQVVEFLVTKLRARVTNNNEAS